MSLTIEPLFGGIEFITQPQWDAVKKALPILAPGRQTVFSEDETEDGTLNAIFNTETAWGQPLAYMLRITPTGVIRSFEWDSINDPSDWEWESAFHLPLWDQLTAAGLSYEVDDDG